LWQVLWPALPAMAHKMEQQVQGTSPGALWGYSACVLWPQSFLTLRGSCLGVCRWNQLPVLLAMTIGNVSLAAAGYSPVTRTFSNEVHALGICLKAMAVAQEEASNRWAA
jgi:hypothetical protein